MTAKPLFENWAGVASRPFPELTGVPSVHCAERFSANTKETNKNNITLNNFINTINYDTTSTLLNVHNTQENKKSYK